MAMRTGTWMYGAETTKMKTAWMRCGVDARRNINIEMRRMGIFAARLELKWLWQCVLRNGCTQFEI